MREIEGLALWSPFRDVEKHDVAKLLERCQVSQGSADLTGSDQCDLATRHLVSFFLAMWRKLAKKRPRKS